MNVVEIVFSPTGGTEKIADIKGSRYYRKTIGMKTRQKSI